MKPKKERTPPEPKTPANVWDLPDGHHMGYTNGFNKKNGDLYPAPMITEPMEELWIERQALQSFIDAMQRHVHDQMKKITVLENEWWKYAERDLGIRRGEASYHYNERCFRKVEPAPLPSDTERP